MELLKVVTFVGSLVLVVGLLRMHRLVVREHLLPSIEDDENEEAGD